MSGAAWVTIVAVGLIVLALVYYLVSVILELRKVTNGLDEAIAGVSGIVEKSAPVNDVVRTINQQLDAGVDLLEGLLVKKAGLYGRGRPRRRPLSGGRRGRAPELPREHRGQGAPHRRGLHEGHAHARAARPRGADRRRQPCRPGAQGRDRRAPGRELYPEIRQKRPAAMPRSPVIGTDAPVQYEEREDIGAPRKRLPTAPE